MRLRKALKKIEGKLSFKIQEKVTVVLTFLVNGFCMKRLVAQFALKDISLLFSGALFVFTNCRLMSCTIICFCYKGFSRTLLP